MIDINLIRQEPEVVKASLEKRGESTGVVDEIAKLDEEWRGMLQQSEKLKHHRNKISLKISELKKQKKDIKAKITEMRELNDDITSHDSKTREKKEQIDKQMLTVPNLLHDSVPKGDSDEDNEVLREVGNKPKFEFKPKSHIDLGESLDLIDIQKASEVSGARFYYLKNEAVLLEFALVRFVMGRLVKEGFVPVVTPALIRGQVMEGAGFLPAGKDDIYKIEDQDLYLVGTSEQALSGLHMGEIVERSELPKYYAGFSSCFRTEAGSHGKDTKGIFRVHQFDKIEMFMFTEPEKSWDEYEKLLKIAEGIYRDLEIPYRVVNVCTSEMGVVAAKKYDIEAWFPSQGTYREVVSCSNCTDYQARRLNVKCRAGMQEKPVHVHTLNSTACAISRTLVAIIENFQQKDGTIRVPQALQDYLNFKTIG